jgi:hypothetical protein
MWKTNLQFETTERIPLFLASQLKICEVLNFLKGKLGIEVYD